MDRLSAERIAAATAGVTLDQAQLVVAQLLRELSKCAVCQDTGRFTLEEGIDVEIWYKGAHGYTSAYLPASTDTQCPRCRTGEGDPAFVRWFCRSSLPKDKCEATRAEYPDEHWHDPCGWRVLLPVPGREQESVEMPATPAAEVDTNDTEAVPPEQGRPTVTEAHRQEWHRG